MLERTIINYHDLEVKLSDHADKGIMDILDHAVQGAEGGLRFSLRNIGARIGAYGDKVRFLSVYRKNKITGTAGACFQVTGQGLLRYPSTYIKYLAFLSSYQTNIKRSKKEVTIIKHDDNDSFKQKTLELFGKPHILELPDVFEADKHILYAFVESMNERSKNIVNQAGFEYIRSFLTVAFSRFNPKKDPRVGKLSKGEIGVMRQLVREYYANHAFYTDDHLFDGDNYYVMKEGEEIIAGIWALPTEYKVYDLPGIWGWVLKKVIPSLPLYRRLFPSEVFKCLVFDAVYCKKGSEPQLTDLLSSALAEEGMNTGLIWLDDHSELYGKMRSEVKLGPLNRILNAKPGLVYAKFINLTEEEKERFYDSPAYISGFDFS